MSKSSESKPKKSDKKKADKKPRRVTGQNVGPQGFFPEHGEKLGFGLFGLVVLLCAWSAVGHDSYNKTPAELANALLQRRTAVQQNKAEDSPLLTPLRGKPYGELATGSVEPVAGVERFPVPGVRNPYIDVVLKRGEPELYPAEDGKVFMMVFPAVWETPELKKPGGKPAKPAPAGGKAKPPDPFALLAPAADPKGKNKPKAPGAVPAVPVAPPGPVAMGAVPAAPLRGVRVPPTTEYRGMQSAMIIFRVPRVKEAEAFRRVFENTRDYQPGRDTANYVSFWIQRKTDDGQWEDTVTIDTPSGRQTMSFAQAFWETQKHFPQEFLFAEIVDTAQEDCVIPFRMAAGPDGSGWMPEGFTVSPLPPILADNFNEDAAGGFPLKQSAAAPGFPGGGLPGGVLPGGPAVAPGMGPGAPAPGVGPMPVGGQPGEAIPRIRGQQRGGRGKSPGGSTAKGGPGGGAWQGGPGGRMIGGAAASASGGGPQFSTGNSGQKMIGGKPASDAVSGPNFSTGNAAGGGTVGNPFAPRQNPNQQVVGSGNIAQVHVAQVSDVLLRFFDFTVEEGHTYQYRVMVVLKNPNHKLPPGLLKDADSAKEEFLRSGYSEPTEPVRMTIGGSQVIAGPVKPARIAGGFADSATVILRQRDRAKGAVVAHTFHKLEAGQVLNAHVAEIKFEKPVGGVDSLPQFTFQSDNLVLDLRGGERGPPGEMLLLDSGGRLVVASEIGKSNPTFAAEAARLESIYSQQQPAIPAEAGGGVGFGAINNPAAVPMPIPGKKPKAK